MGFYFRRSHLIWKDNIDKRLEKIKREIIKLRIQGVDTVEIDKELETIEKDLKIGLSGMAEYRLEEIEGRLNKCKKI
ncbi:MAG: hypothetical protein B6U88_02375 [Candidatus Aenigmarchaeota archaeon ex4484_56]|nr:MAG: hypothetical protein B6U88_02375 [Candidatus Aenigmarchaeota archaeon ex4484_56]